MNRKSAPKFHKVSLTTMGEILCGMNTISIPVLDILKYRLPEHHSFIRKAEESQRVLEWGLWAHVFKP